MTLSTLLNTMMNQQQIEKLNDEEYSALLAFGSPMSIVVQSCAQAEYSVEWISILDSTTYAGMTFGYHSAPSVSTAV